MASIGAALVAGAVAATQPWLDRHFLPNFFPTRQQYLLVEKVARLAMAIAGVALATVARTRMARLVASHFADLLRAGVAAVLALAASELVLARIHARPAEWLWPGEEPRRMVDPHLGWRFVPSRTGRSTIAERVIEYSFDAAGYRVRTEDEPVDPAQPTILFTGESVMNGEGLTWDESIPAQAGAMLHVQSATLAVNGFSNDQAYMRLEAELPRFRHPVAVVSLFMTTLFDRNLDDDRPHLGPGLVWLPAVRRGHLASLASILVPYRSDAAVERGIRVTRDVLAATARLARGRGAIPLILVPHVGPEENVDRRLRGRVLGDVDPPCVYVEIDPAWVLPKDGHPNAAAAHAMAAAVAARLADLSRDRNPASAW